MVTIDREFNTDRTLYRVDKKCHLCGLVLDSIQHLEPDPTGTLPYDPVIRPPLCSRCWIKRIAGVQQKSELETIQALQKADQKALQIATETQQKSESEIEIVMVAEKDAVQIINEIQENTKQIINRAENVQVEANILLNQAQEKALEIKQKALAISVEIVANIILNQAQEKALEIKQKAFDVSLEIVGEARKEAKQIISWAKNMQIEANNSVRQAQEKAREIVVDAQKKAQDIYNDISVKTQLEISKTEKAKLDAEKIVNEAQQEAQKIITRAKNVQIEANSTLKQAQEKAQEIIDIVDRAEQRTQNRRLKVIAVVPNKAQNTVEVENKGSEYYIFAMFYLGLFISFLVVTMAVDMPSNLNKVFILGTITFGVVSLVLSLTWWRKRNMPLKQIKKLSNRDDDDDVAIQID